MKNYWDYSKFAGAGFYFMSCSILEAPLYFAVSTSMIVFLLYGIVVDIAKLNQRLDEKQRREDEIEKRKNQQNIKSGTSTQA